MLAAGFAVPPRRIVSGPSESSPTRGSRSAFGAAHLLPDAAQAATGSVGRPTGGQDGDTLPPDGCAWSRLSTLGTHCSCGVGAHGLTTRRRPARPVSQPAGWPPRPCSPARRLGDHGQAAPGPRRRVARFSGRAPAGCADRTAAPSSCATRMTSSTRTCTRTSLRGLVAEMAARRCRRSP